MNSWVAAIPRDQARGLGSLRLIPGLTACLHDDLIWLRTTDPADDLTQELRKLPGTTFYTLTPGGELVQQGRRLPSRRLPPVNWQSLTALLTPAASPQPVPNRAVSRLELSLVRVFDEQPAFALETSLAEWEQFVETAPKLRLDPLEFLTARDQRTLVVGIPLPPLKGQRYWHREGVFVPAGYHWSPAIDAHTLRDVLGLAADELAIFEVDATWRRASRTELVRASRRSLRATIAEVGHGAR